MRLDRPLIGTRLCSESATAHLADVQAIIVITQVVHDDNDDMTAESDSAVVGQHL